MVEKMDKGNGNGGGGGDEIAPPWVTKILTLFPQLFPGPLAYSITGRGLREGRWTLTARNIRDYAEDRHGTVDDPPYGGGGGMVLRPDVLGRAVEQEFVLGRPDLPIVYLSPRGTPFKQEIAERWGGGAGIQLICGRFEGVDQRLLDEFEVEEVSLGDYVISNGDIAAYILLDACVRCLPGVITQQSLDEESFSAETGYGQLLEYPHYTKPATWRGRSVPEVLLSGNHAEIAAWRRHQAELLTRERRPDLLDAGVGAAAE